MYDSNLRTIKIPFAKMYFFTVLWLEADFPHAALTLHIHFHLRGITQSITVSLIFISLEKHLEAV